MLRRAVPVTSSSAVTSFTASSCGLLASSTRGYFDPNQSISESLHMTREDFANMFPSKKPRVNAGEYGYQRHTYHSCFLSPNPCIRMPHERRRLNPKKAEIVTVFGATGYLGVEICRELLALPEIKQVRACTRYPTHIKPGTEFAKLLEEADSRLELHECDVTDRIQVNVAANGADTLIHAVDFHMEYTGNSHYEVYVHGAINVAWTARNVRSERVIFCSDLCSTFASESNYVDMLSRGEEAVTGNFPDATIMRFGHLYGKNYRYRGLGKYIYPTVFPSTRCEPLWVTDAARAVARSARADRAVRFKLDLGGPENWSHSQFIAAMGRHYRPRIQFPVPFSIAWGVSKLMQWTVPNPWFDDNLMLTWELDAVPRNTGMFDRLGGWDRIAYKPHTMKEAAAIDHGNAELPAFAPLQAEYEALEARDRDKFKAEEEDAMRAGIHRAKAEPAHGRQDGMELLATEIYPGSQFRIRSLDHQDRAEGREDVAKYPDTVENSPHKFPSSSH